MSWLRQAERVRCCPRSWQESLSSSFPRSGTNRKTRSALWKPERVCAFLHGVAHRRDSGQRSKRSSRTIRSVTAQSVSLKASDDAEALRMLRDSWRKSCHAGIEPEETAPASDKSSPCADSWASDRGGPDSIGIVTFALPITQSDAVRAARRRTLVAAKANLIEWGQCTSQGSVKL